MKILFNNILIPVDFSINTELAVKKALALIEPGAAAIHLLHVLPSVLPVTVNRFFSSSTFYDKADQNIAMRKLEQWRECIAERYPGLQVHVVLVRDNFIQKKIAQLAVEIQPQLIIIGKHNYHNWFTFLNTVQPSALSKTANCPVLSVKLGSLNNKIKTIVFPIQTIVPNKKLDLLITLAKRYRARVYLVILENPSHDNSAQLYNAFIETNRLLKSTLNTPIDHKIVKGTNLTKAALQFAESINADMILVNPSESGKISVLPVQQVTDVIKGNSKLEVLSVQA